MRNKWMNMIESTRTMTCHKISSRYQDFRLLNKIHNMYVLLVFDANSNHFDLSYQKFVLSKFDCILNACKSACWRLWSFTNIKQSTISIACNICMSIQILYNIQVIHFYTTRARNSPLTMWTTIIGPRAIVLSPTLEPGGTMDAIQGIHLQLIW